MRPPEAECACSEYTDDVQDHTHTHTKVGMLVCGRSDLRGTVDVSGKLRTSRFSAGLYSF